MNPEPHIYPILYPVNKGYFMAHFIHFIPALFNCQTVTFYPPPTPCGPALPSLDRAFSAQALRPSHCTEQASRLRLCPPLRGGAGRPQDCAQSQKLAHLRRFFNTIILVNKILDSCCCCCCRLSLTRLEESPAAPSSGPINLSQLLQPRLTPTPSRSRSRSR